MGGPMRTPVAGAPRPGMLFAIDVALFQDGTYVQTVRVFLGVPFYVTPATLIEAAIYPVVREGEAP